MAREAPQLAIRQFAVEVDDPSGDLIGSVLLLAMSHSGRTADLLSELASTIRERATMRLRIEAARNGARLSSLAAAIAFCNSRISSSVSFSVRPRNMTCCAASTAGLILRSVRFPS